MSVQSIQKVAQFDNNKGKNYREILDLLKQGKVPISLEFYNKNRAGIERKLLAYLPAASNLHGSFAPQGVSFEDANKKYGNRYDGYHVSEDPSTGEKILFPLAKKLPDAKGNEVDVPKAKDSIVLVRLDSVDGKPTMEQGHDPKTKETLVQLNTDKIICVPFLTMDGWYELKNGNFEKSDASNPNANYVWRADGVNWNGVFALGNSGVGNYGDRNLIADHGPSNRLGVLISADGAKIAAKPEIKIAAASNMKKLVANANHEVENAATWLPDGWLANTKLLIEQIKKQLGQ